MNSIIVLHVLFLILINRLVPVVFRIKKSIYSFTPTIFSKYSVCMLDLLVFDWDFKR